MLVEKVDLVIYGTMLFIPSIKGYFKVLSLHFF